MTKIATPKQILSFWKKAGPKRWFKANSAFDQKIREQFLVTHQAAEMEKFGSWEENAEGALALVLLLDQFPRNMFRGTARAFVNDVLAREVTGRAIERGFDRKIDPAFRNFFYVPYMHSENLADQVRCLKLSKGLPGKDADKYAKIHYAIIKRFGRFPHRNEILGRNSTSEEIAFLEAA